MAAGREDLLCEVKRKVACIQDAIFSISEKQQQLSSSALGAKSDIHAALSRQLEALRNREVWLLDQVDVVLRIQDQLLQEHLVCLMHELGGLQRLVEFAQRREDDGETVTEELALTLTRLDLLNLQPLENTSINFSADMASLRRAILDFGEIDAKRPRLSHDVGMSQQSSPYECSYDPADWLAKDSASSSTNYDEDGFVMLDDDQSETDVDIIPTMSEDTEPQPPPTAGPAPTFDLITEIVNSPLSGWLFDRDHVQGQYLMDFSCFKEVSQDVKSWLIDCEHTMEDDSEEQEIEEDKPSCPKPACACAASKEGPQFYEIENLAALLCVQETPPSNPVPKTTAFNTHKWLASPKEDNQEEKELDVQESGEVEWLKSPFPRVEEVCRANEPCKDFSECLSDTNCCLGNADQSSWLLPNGKAKNSVDGCSFGGEPAGIDLWLLPQQQQSHWLAQDKETPSEANDLPSTIENFVKQQSKMTSDWLAHEVSEGGPCPTANGSVGFFEHLSNDPSDWLVIDRICLDQNHSSPQCLEVESTLYASLTSNWLCSGNSDLGESNKQPFEIFVESRSDKVSDWPANRNVTSPYPIANDQSPLKGYFADRSETSDWIVREEPAYPVPQPTVYYSNTLESQEWLFAHDQEKKSCHTFPTLDKYSDWHQRGYQTYSEDKECLDPVYEIPDKMWLISNGSESWDNKESSEDVSLWLRRCSLSADEVEREATENPKLWDSSFPGVADPTTGTLLPCFTEKTDVEKWLVA